MPTYHAASPPPVRPEARFQDCLGVRLVRTDPQGESVEVFRPDPEIAAMRESIHERVERLAKFRQARFVPVLRIESGSGEANAVEIISDHVPGVRLAEILAAAGKGRFVIETGTALHFVRELLAALATLHESRGVTHGAIGPERLLVTPGGRLMVADYVLGLALERLRISRSRLWTEFRIPMPASGFRASIDVRADIAQIAVVGIALLLGRLLESREYPRGIVALIDAMTVVGPAERRQAIPASMKTWLKRAVGVEGHRPFATAREAQMALETVLSKHAKLEAAPNSFKALFDLHLRSHRPEGNPTDSPTAQLDRIRISRIEAELAGPFAAGSTRRADLRTVGASSLAEDASLDAGVTPGASETAVPSLVEEWPTTGQIFHSNGAEEMVSQAACDLSEAGPAPVSFVELPPIDVVPPFNPLIGQLVAEAETAPEAVLQTAVHEPVRESSRAEALLAAILVEFDSPSEHAAAQSTAFSSEANDVPDVTLDDRPVEAIRWEPLTIRPSLAGLAAREAASRRPRLDVETSVAPIAALADAMPLGDAPAQPVESARGAREDVAAAIDIGAASFEAVPEFAEIIVPAPAAASIESERAERRARAVEMNRRQPLRPPAEPLVASSTRARRRPALASQDLALSGSEAAAPALVDAPDRVAFAAPDVPALSASRPILPALEPSTAGPIADAAFADLESDGLRLATPGPLFDRALPEEDDDRPRIDLGGALLAARSASAAFAGRAAAGLASLVAGLLAGAGAVAARAGALASLAGVLVLRLIALCVRSAVLLGRGIAGIGRAVVRTGRAVVLGASRSLSAAFDAVRMCLRAVRLVARGAVRLAESIGSGVLSGCRLAWLLAGRAAARLASAALAGGLAGLRAGAAGATIAVRGLRAAVSAFARLVTASARVAARAGRVASVACGAGLWKGLALAGRAMRAAGSGALVVMAWIGRSIVRLAHVAGIAGAVAGRAARSAARAALHPGFLVPRPQYLLAGLVVPLALQGLELARERWLNPYAQVGTLRINAKPGGLLVRIDGVAHRSGELSATLAAGLHRLEFVGWGFSRTKDVMVESGQETIIGVERRPASPTGTLRVESQPEGAEVLVDGVSRGRSPLTLEAVKAGNHVVLVKGASGSVTRTVNITADTVAEVMMPIYSGWIAVFAPVELNIIDQGRLIGTSESGHILVSPGEHTVELVSERLGFRTTRTAVVKPGEVAALNLELPPAPLEVVAPAGSEVRVDGQLIGTAPLGRVEVAVGIREVSIRHPSLGEKSQTTTVTYASANKVVFEPQR
jgi:hypothetical protein